MSQKEVKKKGVKNFDSQNFDLTIYNEILKGSYPAKIANKYGVSKQRVSYHVQKLLRDGCVRYLGCGVWEAIKPPTEGVKKWVKKKGNPHSQSFKNPFYKEAPKIRSHAFMFKLSPKVPSYWHRRAEILKKLNREFKQFKGFQTLEIYGKKVVLYNKTIVIYDKTSYISDSASKNRDTALLTFFRIVRRIENLFKCDFSFGGQYKFDIVKEHHSLINNSLAKKYEEENKKLSIADAYGKWGGIDNSFNLHEFEVYRNQDPNKNQAIDDTEGVVKFFNSLKATGYEATPQFLMEAINKVTQNQLIFAENMKTHIEAIRTLSASVKELQRTVQELTKVIRK